MSNLDELGSLVHGIAKTKGFWEQGTAEEFPFFAYKLAMVHSEITEILEAVRKSKPVEELEEEFADTVIRLVDLYEAMLIAGMVNRPLDDVVQEKIEKNSRRPKLHGVKG